MAYTDIDKPSDYFNTVLYTGTGGTSNSVTGVGFQPDWLWLKSRSNAYPNFTYDAVRTNRSALFTDNSNAEDTGASNQMTSFDSDGFTVVDSGGSVGTNASGATFVAWNWLANNTSGSSNTDGSITSTVSANTTSGFSIVSYTGNGSTNQTIGHGLGVEPDFIIVKARSTTMNWPTYQKVMGNGVAFLDVPDAWASGGGYDNYWYISGMTSSTFGVSNNINTNTSGATYIAYCFADKKGFSKFGKYTGNGSSDGTFIYTGFKPAWILIKVTSTANNWYLQDSKRAPFNSVDTTLSPTDVNAETDFSTNDTDFLSNGFKLRNSNTGFNSSGNNYIYMAFAENPFVTSTGIPACAR